MKKIYIFLCITIASLTQLQAQAPQGFNYQATVRNNSGDLVVNTNVYFKFNVIQGSQTAVPIFTETHYVPTDDLGQVNLVIGQGTANTGIFSELDWSLGSYYLGIELNTGSGYVAMGTTQLLSVPYALYAENSGNSTPTTPTLQSVLAENNSAGQQQIKNLLNPTDGADAVTKSYVDALSNTQGLMNFNEWDNYQILNDNTTFQLEPNSFVFLDANNTTLIFPDGSENGFGDAIYIYVVQEGSVGVDITLQPSGFPIRIPAYDQPSYDDYFGILGCGLNTIINVGDYWMVADFQGQIITDSDIDMTNGTFTQCEGVLYDSGGELNNYSGNEDYTLTICPDGSGTSTVLEFISFVTQASVDVLTIFNGTTTSDPILGTYSGTQTLGTITADNTSGCLTLRFVSNGGVNTAGFAANISCDFFGTVTDIDGNTYDYLTYGDQVWTVENAEMVTYRDGTPIPEVTDATEWENLTTGAWAYYNNDPTKPRLYNWYAVMGIHDAASLPDATLRKEFAPEGWHVPSDAEWTTLEEHLIANGYNYDSTTTGNKIAKAMASTTGWVSQTNAGAPGNDQSINNSSGFNAFSEGGRYHIGLFNDEGGNAIFWSSTESDIESDTDAAWNRYLASDYSYLFRSNFSKRSGFSVRFVRD
jgi:uncharacterized protein (TIGR02145 family)